MTSIPVRIKKQIIMRLAIQAAIADVIAKKGKYEMPKAVQYSDTTDQALKNVDYNLYAISADQMTSPVTKLQLLGQIQVALTNHIKNVQHLAEKSPGNK